MRLQTLQPKFHLRIAAVVILALVFLGFLSFTKHGVFRAYYGGFACLAAVGLIVQYCRERTIVHNRLSAVGVVTEYRMPLRSGSRIIRFLAPKFSPEVPLIKYSFVAFDQKAYTGETGWGSHGLFKGAQITVLYNPENPAANHPLTSFIFYFFH
jgi:hypothetical protein